MCEEAKATFSAGFSDCSREKSISLTNIALID